MTQYFPFNENMKAEESKTQLNTSKKQKSEHEKSEINDETMYVDDMSTKPRGIKPNNVPAALLILAIILANLEVSKGMTCPKASDIKWISKRTNKLVGCTPCQPCHPSQEFSIPCGTKAYIGTVAKCIPCPNGKFSDGFNIKPCVSCTICSNRLVKQNCTFSRNSVCGDCKPGYYLEIALFGCIKCAKCCHDGLDETHASCSSVNLCKARPLGCPVVPTTKASTLSSVKHNQTTWSLLITKSFASPKVINQTVKSWYHSPGTGQSGSGMINMTTDVYENHKREPIVSSTAQQSTQKGFVHNPWFIVCIVILIVAVIVLIIFVVILTIKNHKLKKSDKGAVVENTEYKPVSHEDPNPSQAEMGQLQDQTLEQFMDRNYDVIDKLCKLLMQKHLGKFDFERLALEWKIAKEDVTYIQSEIHVQQGSPVRKLLEVLCSQRLCTTVRQLADSIKKINNEAYETLKPHFLKPNEA